MKNTQKLMKLFCLAVSFAVVLSACGNSSYNDRSLILSNEDSYTYQKCVDTGSTDTSLKREFQGFNGKDTIWMLDATDNRDSFCYAGNTSRRFQFFRNNQPSTTNAATIWYTIGCSANWTVLLDYIQCETVLRKL